MTFWLRADGMSRVARELDDGPAGFETASISAIQRGRSSFVPLLIDVLLLRGERAGTARSKVVGAFWASVRMCVGE